MEGPRAHWNILEQKPANGRLGCSSQKQPHTSQQSRADGNKIGWNSQECPTKGSTQGQQAARGHGGEGCVRAGSLPCPAPFRSGPTVFRPLHP